MWKWLKSILHPACINPGVQLATDLFSLQTADAIEAAHSVWFDAKSSNIRSPLVVGNTEIAFNTQVRYVLCSYDNRFGIQDQLESK
jgi:hypothetical protein